MLLRLLLARAAAFTTPAPLRSLLSRPALLALLTQAAAFTTPSHDELCRAQAAPGCLQILKEIHLERIVEDRVLLRLAEAALRAEHLLLLRADTRMRVH